jgi:hypothetical protein
MKLLGTSAIFYFGRSSATCDASAFDSTPSDDGVCECEKVEEVNANAEQDICCTVR